MTCIDKTKVCARGLFYLAIFTVVTSLGMLYSLQEQLLYIPSMPYRFNHENPSGYHSPNDRNINYEDVELDRGDGVVIRGWYMNH